jgi:hypothetical protein
VNPKDLQAMRRRLAEQEDLITHGYDPAYPDRREPWIKRHAGDVLSRQDALRQIRSEQQRRSA